MLHPCAPGFLCSTPPGSLIGMPREAPSTRCTCSRGHRYPTHPSAPQGRLGRLLWPSSAALSSVPDPAFVPYRTRTSSRCVPSTRTGPWCLAASSRGSAAQPSPDRNPGDSAALCSTSGPGCPGTQGTSTAPRLLLRTSRKLPPPGLCPATHGVHRTIPPCCASSD